MLIENENANEKENEKENNVWAEQISVNIFPEHLAALLCLCGCCAYCFCCGCCAPHAALRSLWQLLPQLAAPHLTAAEQLMYPGRAGERAGEKERERKRERGSGGQTNKCHLCRVSFEKNVKYTKRKRNGKATKEGRGSRRKDKCQQGWRGEVGSMWKVKNKSNKKGSKAERERAQERRKIRKTWARRWECVCVCECYGECVCMCVCLCETGCGRASEQILQCS